MSARSRNLLFCGLLIGLVVFFVDSHRGVYAEIEYQWLAPAVDLNQYEDIYIYAIDVRDIELEVFDDDEEEFIAEPFEANILEEVANRLHGRFVTRLQSIFPINSSHQVDASKKSLVVNIKLSAMFRFEDPGLLTKFLIRGQTSATDVSMECSVKDSQSGKQIFLFKDTKSYETMSSEMPLSTKKDLDALEEILGVWARRFGNILEAQKNKKVTAVFEG